MRTIGITQDNMDYFKHNIFDLKKKSWCVKKIKVFNDSDNKNEILNFGSINTNLFSVIKYNELVQTDAANI